MRDIRKRDTIISEYIDVIINHKLFQLCNDCYHALGWKTIRSRFGIASIKLRLERNRKIKNRVELCKLQRECEDALMELEKLVKAKKMKEIHLAEINRYYDMIYQLIKKAEHLIC
jgi:hypothetical protein